MNALIRMKKIGDVSIEKDQCSIRISPDYRPGLHQLEGFSHIFVLWWAHQSDSRRQRNCLKIGGLFKALPEMGVFASRAPFRPNPVMLSIVPVLDLNTKDGIISIPTIDAAHGSPVIDIKPYHLMDRVKHCNVPNWCSHWPESFEKYRAYNWDKELKTTNLIRVHSNTTTVSKKPVLK